MGSIETTSEVIAFWLYEVQDSKEPNTISGGYRRARGYDYDTLADDLAALMEHLVGPSVRGPA